jgi:arylsulfatase A-like enzyme
MLKVSADYGWSVPLALTITVFAASLPWLVIRGRFFHLAARLAVFLASAIVVLDLLMLVPRLAPYAAAVLAAGLAAQFTRSFVQRTDRMAPVVHRALPVLVVLVAVAGGAISLAGSRAPAPATGAATVGPNVLFITLDTVRASSLSLYGYSRLTSPNLTRFGRQGVVFDNAFTTAPWTLPSHSSMFTGRWPHELSASYDHQLDTRYPTLAEYFAGRGYATAGFVANLEYCGAPTGLARGFGHYEDYPRSVGQVVSNSTLLRGIADNFTLRRLVKNDEHLNRVTAADINGRFLSWLETAGQQPFFAFLNYFDAHEPYLPPPPFDRAYGPGRSTGRVSPIHHAQWDPSSPSREIAPEFLREEIDAYDGALTYLDQQLGSLFDRLAARGLLASTVVVITADHGEEFAEHRVLEHGYSLYREGLHVPLLIVRPGTSAAGARVKTPVSLRDVAATLVDLTGGPVGAMPGASLSTVITSSNTSGSPVFSELSKPPGKLPNWFQKS